jgi:hypothetical protein
LINRKLDLNWFTVGRKYIGYIGINLQDSCRFISAAINKEFSERKIEKLQ